MSLSGHPLSFHQYIIKWETLSRQDPKYDLSWKEEGYNKVQGLLRLCPMK